VHIPTFAEARLAVASGESIGEVAQAFVAGLTPQERLWCLDGDAPTWAGLGFMTEQNGYHKALFTAGRVDRVSLPGIRFTDGPRGAVIGNATCFPVSMARGATWDPELEERIGDAIGLELRALGANLTGAVCVNLLRHPAWGRAQETYGEDPHHVGEVGAAFTRGLQRHVMACVKHFACNSMENARFSVDIEVDDVALHEVYLPHFKRIIDEGVASVMSAYNSINGEWCGQNHELLTSILRDEWGFEGFVISDFVFGLRDAARSLNAGLDVEMPHRMIRAQHLSGALERGEASWADVDRSVERVVATLLRFDHILSSQPPSLEVIGSPEHRRLAREAAAKSIVLLRNEPVDGAPVLPITDSGARIAVIGRLADTVNVGDGGSSDVWDLECHTVLDGICDRFANVISHDGTDPVAAAEVAGGADVVVVVVGYTYLDEGEFIGSTDPALGALLPAADEPDVAARYEAALAALPATTKPEHLVGRTRGFSMGGDRSSLRLAPSDVELIRAVAAANRRTVVVIQSGSAVITTEWVEDVPAIVQAWYGGAEAGPGLVDVLVGDVNPSARLPFTVPVDEADLPAFDRNATTFVYDRWHGWWRASRNNIVPAYPFGFGLSYTTFVVGDVEVFVDDSAIVVRGTVRNTGERDGSDVIQVYAEVPDPDAPARLVGFTRASVAAGQQATFEIVVTRAQLATRQPEHKSWQPPTGQHTISVSRFVGDPNATSIVVGL
jgi:beta-glucosidase